jgi:protein arginine N-methyltransferase 1
MYSIADYGDMIADQPRLGAYAEAIRRVVRPGSVVLDLGAGTGILSLIACQCGARKVYALDSANAVQLVGPAARANGFADRIEVLQQSSTQVNLPEPAEVIISDLRGVLPLSGPGLPALMDARRRLLAPGGRLIPQSERLWVALLEAPDQGRRYLGPWEHGPYGLDLRSVLPVAANTFHQARAEPGQLLTEPEVWALLTYEALISPHVQGVARPRVHRPGTAHGLLVWFDSVLAEGVSFSNAPGEPKMIYGQLFFPWPEPVPVREGDVALVHLRAQLVGEEYVWCWESTVRGPEAPGGERCHFRQSTFPGVPLPPERLHKIAAGFVPALNEDGRILHFLLGQMGGQVSLGELARELAGRFPGRFPTWPEALSFLGDFSVRYSQ